MIKVNSPVVADRIGFPDTEPLVTDTDAATITFDMALSDLHQVQITSNRTLAVSNVTVGQHFYLIIQQAAAGGKAITWFAGINWSGSAPTLSAGANAKDIFEFWCVSAGSYLGHTVVQNIA